MAQAATAANDPGKDTVGEEARLALQKASGDVAKAAALLIEKVRRDWALKTALLDPLLEYACHQAVSNVHRRFRDTIWSPPVAPRAGMTDAQKVAALAADNLLLFPLPGGKPLGEAGRDEVVQASDFYGKQAVDMAHKSRWLGLIAQSVPAGKAVKEVLSSARLRELQKEVRDAA